MGLMILFSYCAADIIGLHIYKTDSGLKFLYLRDTAAIGALLKGDIAITRL